MSAHSGCLRALFTALVVLVGFALFIGSPPVWAQEEAASSQSFDEALRTLPFAWDERKNGVLIGVTLNIDEAFDDRGQTRDAMKPSASGDFLIPNIAAYFKRRVVSAGSVTVLAPAFTTLLATRLPEPNIYADLSLSEKLRRLESTLSPVQWRSITSPGGIGQADLVPSQQRLWASLLPESLNLSRTRNENGVAVYDDRYERNFPPLSSVQRAGVRLVLYREISWDANKKIPQFGTDFPRPYDPPTQNATGPNGTGTLSLQEDSSWGRGDPQPTVFGVVIKKVVPFQLKPSDLAYEGAVLNTPVSVAHAKTVGDLIAEVRIKTRLDLYCDPRYRTLSVYTRGGGSQTVRAGDLLQAIALSVMGTFRCVSDGKNTAFVLTDDLEGLGTRQTRIKDWVQAAVAQKRVDDALMETRLSKTNVGDFIAWRFDDPNAPTGELARRIEDYRAGKIVPTDAEGKTQNTTPNVNFGLWVPISHLPPFSQYAIGQLAKGDDGEGVAPPRPATVPTDRVKINVHTGVAFFIPGVGRVEAAGWSMGNHFQSLLPDPPPPNLYGKSRGFWGIDKTAAAAPKPEPFALTHPGGAVRALLLSLPKNAAEARTAVSAASDHGFNQLWVELPLGEITPPMLAQTIAVAKKSSLRVQAVVRPFRRLPYQSPSLARDVNVVGETVTEAANREVNHVIPGDAIGANFLFLIQGQDETRQIALRHKAAGDLLDANAPVVQTALMADLLALARTPGLAGIVARETAPPSSDGGLGYTRGARLHFLQQTGLDPVDLSPVWDSLFPSGPWGPPPGWELRLPQFPSYGRYTLSDAPADTGINPSLDTKNAWLFWDTFRTEQAKAAWNRLRRKFVSVSLMPLLRQNDENNPDHETVFDVSWTGTWDKPVPNPPLLVEKTPVGLTAPEYKKWFAVSFFQKARQTSTGALLTFRYERARQGEFSFDGLSGEKKNVVLQKEAHWFTARFTDYLGKYKNGWDGLVVDLKAVPIADVLLLLRGLPADPAAPVTEAP